MIERRRDYSKKEASKDARKIYLVCEGKETEKKYFHFFEGLSSNLQLIVIPPESGTDPLKLQELAIATFEGSGRQYSINYMQQDIIWFVIDTDSWENEGKIKPLRDFCVAKNRAILEEFSEVKDYHPWRVGQSNPCFELWEWYHFYDVKPIQAEVDKATSFKEFVNGSIAGGFNYEVDPVRLEDAINHSEKNFSQQENGPDLYSTEMHFIGSEIMRFVGGEIRKLKNKLGY